MTLMTDLALFMQNRSVWQDIAPSTFTVATVDNFYMLQSHAAVQYKAKERSFHGTTI